MRIFLPDGKEDFLSSTDDTNDILYRAYGKTRWDSLMLPNNEAVHAWGEEHRQLTLAPPEKNRAMIARLNLMNDYSRADTDQWRVSSGLNSAFGMFCGAPNMNPNNCPKRK